MLDDRLSDFLSCNFMSQFGLSRAVVADGSEDSTRMRAQRSTGIASENRRQTPYGR